MTVTETESKIKIIGGIYSADTIKSFDVYNNNGSLLFKTPTTPYGFSTTMDCHITSHTDEEIIAATKPLQITCTLNDNRFKASYIPKDCIERHVPAKIFIEKARAIHDSIDEINNGLSPFLDIPVITHNNQSITIGGVFEKPHIVMLKSSNFIDTLNVNDESISYSGDGTLYNGLCQLYIFKDKDSVYHFQFVPLGEYAKGSDNKPYLIDADKIKNLPIKSGIKKISGKVIVQGYITDECKTLVIQIPGSIFEGMKSIDIMDATEAQLYSNSLHLDDIADLFEKQPQVSTSKLVNGLEITFKYTSKITSLVPPENLAISGYINNFKAYVTYN